MLFFVATKKERKKEMVQNEISTIKDHLDIIFKGLCPD